MGLALDTSTSLQSSSSLGPCMAMSSALPLRRIVGEIAAPVLLFFRCVRLHGRPERSTERHLVRLRPRGYTLNGYSGVDVGPLVPGACAVVVRTRTFNGRVTLCFPITLFNLVQCVFYEPSRAVSQDGKSDGDQERVTAGPEECSDNVRLAARTGTKSRALRTADWSAAQPEDVFMCGDAGMSYLDGIAGIRDVVTTNYGTSSSGYLARGVRILVYAVSRISICRGDQERVMAGT